MTEFEFERCRDVVIRADGAVLGGVSRAVCESNAEYSDICQFLTDVPVCRVPTVKYKITLDITLGKGEPLAQDRHFDCIEFVFGGRTVKYLECSVLSAKNIVNAQGYVHAEICISAESREIDE